MRVIFPGPLHENISHYFTNKYYQQCLLPPFVHFQYHIKISTEKFEINRSNRPGSEILAKFTGGNSSAAKQEAMRTLQISGHPRGKTQRFIGRIVNQTNRKHGDIDYYLSQILKSIQAQVQETALTCLLVLKRLV